MPLLAAVIAGCAVASAGPAYAEGPLQAVVSAPPAGSGNEWCDVNTTVHRVLLTVRDDASPLDTVRLCPADGRVTTSFAVDGANRSYLLAEYRDFRTPAVTRLTIYRVGRSVVEVFSTPITIAGSASYRYRAQPDPDGGLFVRFLGETTESGSNLSVLLEEGDE